MDISLASSVKIELYIDGVKYIMEAKPTSIIEAEIAQSKLDCEDEIKEGIKQLGYKDIVDVTRLGDFLNENVAGITMGTVLKRLGYRQSFRLKLKDGYHYFRHNANLTHDTAKEKAKGL